MSTEAQERLDEITRLAVLEVFNLPIEEGKDVQAEIRATAKRLGIPAQEVAKCVVEVLNTAHRKVLVEIAFIFANPDV